MPHFKLLFSDSSGPTTRIVKFCDSADGGLNLPFLAPLPTPEPSGKGNLLHWEFSKIFKGDPDIRPVINGTLKISYDILIRNDILHNCEFSSGDCHRIIPKVTYVWTPLPGSAKLTSLTAFYKLDYGDKTAIGLVKDENSFGKLVKKTAGFAETFVSK